MTIRLSFSTKVLPQSKAAAMSKHYRTYSTCVEAKGKIFLGARGKRAPPYARARVSRAFS